MITREQTESQPAVDLVSVRSRRGEQVLRFLSANSLYAPSAKLAANFSHTFIPEWNRLGKLSFYKKTVSWWIRPMNEITVIFRNECNEILRWPKKCCTAHEKLGANFFACSRYCRVKRAKKYRNIVWTKTVARRSDASSGWVNAQFAIFKLN